jgi:hypothetical protein
MPTMNYQQGQAFKDKIRKAKNLGEVFAIVQKNYDLSTAKIDALQQLTIVPLVEKLIEKFKPELRGDKKPDNPE